MKLRSRKITAWLKKWDFAIMFFGAMLLFSLLASLDEILKDMGLA